MTATTVKSTEVTNAYTGAQSSHKKVNQPVKVAIDTIAVATTSIDEQNDVFLVGRIPSNATVLDVKVLCDDLDSGATPALAVNVGLYYLSGTVVDADCFASAVTTLQAAVVTPTSLRFEADDINDIADEAWAIAGLSADPQEELAIGFTVTTAAATAAAGDVTVIVEYI